MNYPCKAPGTSVFQLRLWTLVGQTVFFIALVLLIAVEATINQAQAQQNPFAPTVQSELRKASEKQPPLRVRAEILPPLVEPQQNATVLLSLSLLEGYRAYADQFAIQWISPGGYKIGQFQLEGAKSFFDEFSKSQREGILGQGSLSFPVEISSRASGSPVLHFQLRYQACTKTYCLFPDTLDIHLPIQLQANTQSSENARNWNQWFSAEGFVQLSHSSIPWALLIAFLAGILTSFTPCIFPLLPITLSVLGKNAHLRGRRHNLLLAHIYVLGIALTYSILGVFAAATGQMFGSLLSHPLVLGLMIAVFVLMAISMWGWWDFQPPEFLRRRLAGDLHVHGYSGVFIYGVLAGVVASPCVGPVLVGILTWIASTQNLALGFAMMLMFALGMGQLLILIGVSSQVTKLLPKSGPWMDRVKRFFAVLLLGVAVFYSTLLPAPYNPKAWLPAFLTGEARKISTPFVVYSNESYELALREGRPMLIDFWAEWCAACEELDQKVFATTEFREATKGFALLKFDATHDSPDLKLLRERYSIVGLPTLVFYDGTGNRRKELDLHEYIPWMEFQKRLQLLEQSTATRETR